MFCGHEYAIQNLKFGLHVEPSNQHILTKLEDIETKRKNNVPSVPSTIGKNQFFKQLPQYSFFFQFRFRKAH